MHLPDVRQSAAKFVTAVFEVADFVEAAHDFGGHVDVYYAAVKEEICKGGKAADVHAVVAGHTDAAENTPKLL